MMLIFLTLPILYFVKSMLKSKSNLIIDSKPIFKMRLKDQQQQQLICIFYVFKYLHTITQ